MRRILPFAIAGAFGYLVDATVLMLTLGWLGPIGGRAVSFTCAVFTTWAINRRFAFGDRSARVGKRRELRDYWLAMLPGAAVNWLAYGAAMAVLPSIGLRPILAVAVGSLAGFAANLTSAHRFAFKGDR